ncbi:hypothetical protein KC207_05020 [Phycicoccus sp. BSK3Z-2]|uniref:Uncharacterized protein n=1 Tax=Phycicoccus avicenniae TaxID=2828860 RepID=A0A941D6M1_9MICO|nr:hypothetical protein [Phycicoccus avicenniae]MBR7742648.1 hypothetical protein [Phycicoccus avicenniae]
MTTRHVLWAVGGVVAVGVVVGILGTVGVVAGSSALSVGSAVVLRTVLSLLGLGFVVVVLARRGPWDRPLPLVGVAAGGLLLDPLLWSATAEAGGPLFGVALTGSTVAGLLLDVVVWLGLAAGTALVGLRGHDEDPRRLR